MNANEFLSEEERKIILAAIEEAEMLTSGEIRLHLDNFCKAEVLDRAAHVFKTLDMHKTEERNGVLFYLAVKDRKFAIIGDAGINSNVPPDFWETVTATVLASFSVGKYAEGLQKGIQLAGEKLKLYFPRKSDDINELSNDISFE